MNGIGRGGGGGGVGLAGQTKVSCIYYYMHIYTTGIQKRNVYFSVMVMPYIVMQGS